MIARWRIVAGVMLSALTPGTSKQAEAAPVGCVATDQPVATRAAMSMLAKGGNAVDAAVAAGFCLSVVRPASCGIGGGGFMLVYLKDDPRTPELDPVRTAINYREQAPAAVWPDYFERIIDPLASKFTGQAVGIPGSVAGLLFALQRYGTLDRATVLEPAIRAAEEGFAVNADYLGGTKDAIDWFNEDFARRERFRFVWQRLLGGGGLKEGDVIRLPEQARALRLIAEGGDQAFVEGPIGEAVIDAVRAAGGVMTRDDLREFKVVESAPLVGEFRGRTLLTMPLPSSGGVTMLEILGILDAYAELHPQAQALARAGDPEWMHPFVEAMKHAFADRAALLGDTRESEACVARLLRRDRLRERAAMIDAERTLAPNAYGERAPLKDDAGTSHLCVVDANGNAVSCTNTINLSFGSRICVEEFGFALNNEMDDFTTQRGRANAFGLRQSDENLPAPGKRPLSSMMPTIVLDGRRDVELVVGAAGGPRIITGALQAMLNVLVFDMPAGDAVSAPRLHHQWLPDLVELDSHWDAARVGAAREAMERKGHRVGSVGRVGSVQLIRRSRDSWQAAGDLGSEQER